MTRKVIQIEIMTSPHKLHAFNLRIGDIVGSSESLGISKEDVLSEISDEIDTLTDSNYSQEETTGEISYKCGHKSKGVIVLDSNELSIAGYLEWKDSVGLDGDKSQCWECYCKDTENKAIQHREKE